MSDASTPPPGRRPPPRALFRALNPLMAAMLRSPLHRFVSGKFLLLSFTGRKSGRRYTTPIGYSRQGDTLLLGTSAPWKHNLRGGAPVRVRLQGRERTGKAQVIADEAGLAERYRAMAANTPDYLRMVGIRVDPDGTPNRDDIAGARRAGRVIVEIRLDGDGAVQ